MSEQRVAASLRRALALSGSLSLLPSPPLPRRRPSLSAPLARSSLFSDPVAAAHFSPLTRAFTQTKTTTTMTARARAHTHAHLGPISQRILSILPQFARFWRAPPPFSFRPPLSGTHFAACFLAPSRVCPRFVPRRFDFLHVPSPALSYTAHDPLAPPPHDKKGRNHADERGEAASQRRVRRQERPPGRPPASFPLGPPSSPRGASLLPAPARRPDSPLPREPTT